LPSVNRLHEELKDRGLAVLLVDFREGSEVVKRAARERGYTAPVLVDEAGDVTGRMYGVWGPPTVYLIDRAGRLVGRAVGPRDWDTPAARRFVETLLSAPAR
jgi:AhpC/TSA family protein